MLFRELAEHFEQLEATSSRKALIQILASLFSKAEESEIDKLAYLCQGRLCPFFEPIEIGLGEKSVAEGIAQAFGSTRSDVMKRYSQLGDLGTVAAELAPERDAEAAPLTLVDAYDGLYVIATTAGSGSVEQRLGIFARLMRRADPLSARYLARIPLGKLRLGIGDPTMLDAFSVAKVGDTSLRKPLELAYNQTSDLGLIAATLWRGGIAAVDEIGIQVGKPIRPALAERLPSAEAIVAKLGRCAVEPKLDGFRCQIHKQGEEVHIYSRNLEDMSAMFPELINATRDHVRAETAIFEGEAVGFNPASEEYLPFQETTKRRRKHGVDEAALTIPLKLFVFDLMYVDGENWAPRPYTERRERMATLIVPNDVIDVTSVTITDDPAVLFAMLLDNVQKGLEGIVCKKLDSIYQAGARNFNWVKLKRAQASHLQDTADCVILGYIFGRGKRASFGAGALLVGVYDPDKDEFTTVTKIGTGLSDNEWREIRRRCDQITVSEKPARVSSILIPSAWVEPEVVIEVLADEVTRSPVHTAGKVGGEPGYALRFPRLVRFRDEDRRAEDATTVREIIGMYEQQAVASSKKKGEEV